MLRISNLWGASSQYFNFVTITWKPKLNSVTILKWTEHVWHLVWNLQVSVVFLCFIIQNGIKTVDPSAETACGDEMYCDRKFKTSWNSPAAITCLKNRLQHVHQCFNGVNAFAKVMNVLRVKVDHNVLHF